MIDQDRDFLIRRNDLTEVKWVSTVAGQALMRVDRRPSKPIARVEQLPGYSAFNAKV
jgi:hypothetical protein